MRATVPVFMTQTDVADMEWITRLEARNEQFKSVADELAEARKRIAELEEGNRSNIELYWQTLNERKEARDLVRTFVDTQNDDYSHVKWSCRKAIVRWEE